MKIKFKSLMALAALACAILALSCSADDGGVYEDDRVVRVLRLNAQPWDVTPNQLITVRQLATQRYSTDIYRFEMVYGCQPVVRAKDGRAGGVVTDLNQIASRSYSPEVYEFYLIGCKR